MRDRLASVVTRCLVVASRKAFAIKTLRFRNNDGSLRRKGGMNLKIPDAAGNILTLRLGP